jgi:hypothetical protein
MGAFLGDTITKTIPREGFLIVGPFATDPQIWHSVELLPGSSKGRKYSKPDRARCNAGASNVAHRLLSKHRAQIVIARHTQSPEDT